MSRGVLVIAMNGQLDPEQANRIKEEVARLIPDLTPVVISNCAGTTFVPRAPYVGNSGPR